METSFIKKNIKFAILLILFTVVVRSQSATTSVPDPNFERVLRKLGYDGTGPDNDGMILTSKAKGIISLSLDRKGISDLSGIEAFVDLVYLVCRGNKLTQVNLDSNVKLKRLNFSENKIESLSLSRNTELTHISCYSNSLTDLDFSNNEKLIYLDIRDNRFLISVNIKNGQNRIIENTFFGKNPRLSCIIVDDPSHSLENWSNDKEPYSNYVLSQQECDELYTKIKDPSFEEALMELNYDGTGPFIDGKILSSKALEVINLFIDNKKIKDLTGIEAFKNLVSLSCNNNEIAVLSLDKNTKLKNLYCYGNKISQLDLSKNTKLQGLYCYNNNLTNLDLSKNNSLISLNLQNNPELTNVNLKNGQNQKLKDIRFGNNPRLTCIIVDDPSYSTDNWSDPADNWIGIKDRQTNYASSQQQCNGLFTEVPDSKFEKTLRELGYDGTGTKNDGKILTSRAIGVSRLFIDNKKIRDLRGIEAFTDLVMLVCQNNEIAKIDLTKNTKLERLVCFKNKIRELNLRENTKLITLSCYSNKISRLDLSKNAFLTYLDFRNNPTLSYVNLKNEQNKKLKRARFGNNPKLLCIAVDDPLWSSENWSERKDQYANYVSSEQQCNGLFTEVPDPRFERVLRKLGLDGTGTKNDGKILTSQTFGFHTLLIGNKKIKDLTGIEAFKNLVYLYCDKNDLTELSLAGNKNLEYLYCQNNKLTNLNLAANTKLSYLSCQGNKLSTLDISKNTSLVRLNCYRNYLSKLDVSQNKDLINLNCNDNSIENLDVSLNTRLYTLNCAYNYITNLDLSKNVNLGKLNCRDNKLTGLNLKNGNNSKITRLFAYNNDLLSCVIVDNPKSFSSKWKLKFDYEVKFVKNQNKCHKSKKKKKKKIRRSLTDRQIVAKQVSEGIISIEIADKDSGEVVREVKIGSNQNNLLYSFNKQQQYDVRGLKNRMIHLKVITNKRVITKKLYLSKGS